MGLLLDVHVSAGADQVAVGDLGIVGKQGVDSGAVGLGDLVQGVAGLDLVDDVALLLRELGILAAGNFFHFVEVQLVIDDFRHVISPSSAVRMLFCVCVSEALFQRFHLLIRAFGRGGSRF